MKRVGPAPPPDSRPVSTRRSTPRAVVALVAIVMLGAVGVVATHLFDSPGVTFALSADVTGLEARTAEGGAVLRDVRTRRAQIVLSADMALPATNNLLNPTSAEVIPSVTIEERDTGAVTLDTLTVPGGAVIEARYFRRENELALNLRTDEGGDGVIEVLTAWAMPVLTHPLTLADPTANVGSDRRAGRQMSIILSDPQVGPTMSPPFAIRSLRLETIEPTPLAIYPVSLINAGQLQFFTYGEALPLQQLQAGVALRFVNLRAEITTLTTNSDGLTLRLFGTADDVHAGFGSAVGSVYPSMFEGFGTLPIVQVLLTTVFSILIALIGGVSIHAAFAKGKDDHEFAAPVQGASAQIEKTEIGGNEPRPKSEPLAAVAISCHADEKERAVLHRSPEGRPTAEDETLCPIDDRTTNDTKS